MTEKDEGVPTHLKGVLWYFHQLFYFKAKLVHKYAVHALKERIPFFFLRFIEV